jgi:hypothetical protein
VAQVEQFVHYVGRCEPARMEDDGLEPLVVGSDPHQAVPDPAELVADREHGNSLVSDLVVLEIEQPLPARDQFLLPRLDNDSHYMLRPGGQPERRPERSPCGSARSAP